MLPHNGDGAAGKLASRPRPAPARIVPAIPLSLSRSKPKNTKRDAQPAGTSTRANGTLGEQARMGEQKKQEQHAVVTETAPAAPVLAGQHNDGHAPEAQEEQVAGGGHAAAPSVDTSVSRSSDAVSVSDDHAAAAPTIEGARSAEPLVNGQAETQSPTVMSSPSTVRKPSDRFEMRQIRTELPPAFVPAEQYTPHSATSSQAQLPSQNLPQGHATNPSVSSIVFGGHDSSRSSPAPPVSAGSAYMPPRNMPFYGHMPHGSESQGQRGYHSGEPSNQRQQGFVPSAPQPPYPSQLEHAHAHLRYPPREGFGSGMISSPGGYGHNSRSGSPFSPSGLDTHRYSAESQFAPGPDQLSNGGKHIPQGPRASFTRHSQHMPPQAQYHVAAPPPHFPYPELATSFENAESLRGFTFSHFNNRDFADCVLEIVDEFGSRQLLEGHRIILSRSPALLTIIRSHDSPTEATLKPLVRVNLSGKQVRMHPVLQAIRYLYGGPLPPFDMYNPTAPPGSFNNVSVNERMDTALQHVATGSWMGIAAIAHRGVDMAASLLNWETINSALEFALDGGISQMWPIEDGEEHASTCSSDDSMNKPEAGGSPKYGHYASGLLQRVIEFTVQNMPPNFYIDSAAPPSLAVPRLPMSAPKHESKSSKSDPRLSKIKFGEMSAEVDNHQRPSPTATAISSILLSLPLPLLRYLLEHPLLTDRLGAETVASIMRQIIGEREVRRIRALKAHATGHGDRGGVYSQLFQNLYWQESVDFSDQSRAGFRLTRKRIGIETPPSSGTESERHNA